jgi:hypothetical protein
MRPILVAAIIALAPLPGRASAQTQQGQPSLSDDEKKPQQNSADEAGVRGRLEDGIKPGKPSDQTEANKKVEDAAADAKNKSDAKTTGKDTVPASGSAGGRNVPDQNAKQEPSSKVEGPTQAAVLVDGRLTAAGAPADVDTVPSKFSERTAADDKLPIAAYALKYLTDEQRRAVRASADGSSESGTRALGGYADIGAIIPTAEALEKLQNFSQSVSGMAGTAYLISEGKLLLVNPRTRVVIGVIE